MNVKKPEKMKQNILVCRGSKKDKETVGTTLLMHGEWQSQNRKKGSISSPTLVNLWNSLLVMATSLDGAISWRSIGCYWSWWLYGPPWLGMLCFRSTGPRETIVGSELPTAAWFPGDTWWVTASPGCWTRWSCGLIQQGSVYVLSIAHCNCTLLWNSQKDSIL